MVYERKKIASISFIGLAVLLILVLYFFIYPLYGMYFPKCMFYSFTGLYCPGCGSQRAISALTHGNILTAIRDNLLAVIALPFLMYSFIVLCINAFGQKHYHDKICYSPLFSNTVLVLIVIFTILRNIPVYPFTLFAPL